MEFGKINFWNKLIFMIGIIANIGGIIALFGIHGSLKTGLILCSVGILLFIIIVIVNYIKKNRELLKKLEIAESNNVPVLEHLTLIRKIFKLKNSKEIHLIGSGTETYYNLLDGLLHDNLLSRGVNVNIAYRVGKDERRHRKLESYDEKWGSLADEYKLDLNFFPISDYNFYFRGILFDKSFGCIGFYHRVNNKTVGGSENCLLVSDDKDLGKYFINNFLKCFDLLDKKQQITIPNEKIS